MKVEAGRRCPPLFVNSILLCGQTNLTLSLTNIENVVSEVIAKPLLLTGPIPEQTVQLVLVVVSHCLVVIY